MTRYNLKVINGPNLNMLGTRQPEVYGAETLKDVEDMCASEARALDVSVSFFQSNSEGALVDTLQACLGTIDGIVLNAGAYTHTSIALRDAIAAIELPVIELHVSHVHARESFRHHSMIAPVCIGMLAGLGVRGYPLALRGLTEYLDGRAS